MLTALFKRPGSSDHGGRDYTSQIDRLTFAIGDIHGRADLFQKMLDRIRIEAEDLGEVARIVLLGDYIDRGPNSADVLEMIVNLRAKDWCDPVVLLGNHELSLIKFCMDSSVGWAWLEHGGLATLTSYGIPNLGDANNPAQWTELQKRILRMIPQTHLRLLCDAKIFFVAGDYLFVHGGVKPGVPIESQTSETLLWIREEFLKAEKACDFVVVHGHSARETAENLEWRIGVDTGAYASGTLTAVKLRQSDREFVQVSR